MWTVCSNLLTHPRSQPISGIHRSFNAHLLPPGTGTLTTELLGLHPAGVSNQEGPVVADEELSELKSRGSVVVLGVVGNEGLGDSLSDGVNLRGVTTTRDADSDVDGAASG